MYGHLSYARWTPILLEAAVFLRFCLMSPGRPAGRKTRTTFRPHPTPVHSPACFYVGSWVGKEQNEVYPGVYSSCKQVVMGVEPSSLERMLGGDINIREGSPVS